MAQGPESKVQTWVRQYLMGRLPHAYIRKIQQGRFSHVGVPDLLMCANGKFIAIEVKTETGKLSKMQEIEINKIRKAGGMAVVIYGKDKDLLDMVIEYANTK